jgi:hypothetical protein
MSVVAETSRGVDEGARQLALQRGFRPDAGAAFNPVQRLWQPTPEYFLSPWLCYVAFVETLIARGAVFRTMSDVLENGHDDSKITVLLDHHVDHYPLETQVMTGWEHERGVVSSVYLFNRVEVPFTRQARLWRVEDLDIEHYQRLERAGFEIGYHQNAVGRVRNLDSVPNYNAKLDKKTIEEAKKLYAADVDNLRRYFDIRTMIPHGGGESNAQLVDLPEGYGDIAWVYNNNTRGGRVKAPIVWENYRDSSGMSPQILGGSKHRWVVNQDNLMMQAEMMEPGLHHVLVHPGRFGKGMPYARYLGFEPEMERASVEYTFDACYDADALPELWDEKVARWGAVREDVIAPEDGLYRVLSDDVGVLRAHASARGLVVPCLVKHEKMSGAVRNAIRGRSKGESGRRISEPIALGAEEARDPARVDGLFAVDFEGAMNTVYSPDVLDHLGGGKGASPWFDVIVLRDVVVRKRKGARALVGVLERMLEGSHLEIEAVLEVGAKALKAALKGSDLRERIESVFSIEFVEGGKRGLLGSSAKVRIVRREPGEGKQGRAWISMDSVRGAREDGHGESGIRWLLRLGVPKPNATVVQRSAYAMRKVALDRLTVGELGVLRSEGLPEDLSARLGDCAVADSEAMGDGRRDALARSLVCGETMADLIHAACERRMHEIRVRSERKPEHAATDFAWPWAYAARAAMLGYRATGEARFAEVVFDAFDRIAAMRDSETGRVDTVRDRVVPAWGSSFYAEYAREKGYDHDTHDDQWNTTVTAAGRICSPVLDLIGAVRTIGGDAGLAARAESALGVCEESLGAFDDEFVDAPNGVGGVYWRVERGEPEPLNHQNSAGHALVRLGELTGDGRWTEKAARLAAYFRSALNVDARDAYWWGYYGPGSRENSRSQSVEDVAHAHLNMHFAVRCVFNGIEFDERDGARFARTFTENLHAGGARFRPGTAPHREPETFKAVYPQHFPAWNVLGVFDERIWGIVDEAVLTRNDWYPEFWLTRQVPLVGYAMRLCRERGCARPDGAGSDAGSVGGGLVRCG